MKPRGRIMPPWNMALGHLHTVPVLCRSPSAFRGEKGNSSGWASHTLHTSLSLLLVFLGPLRQARFRGKQSSLQPAQSNTFSTMASPVQNPTPKTVPGRAIVRRRSASRLRQTSLHALIENAAPMDGATEQSYYDGSSGRRDNVSPLSSPGDMPSPADDIQHSVHYAWERAALGAIEQRDADAISLDSLQRNGRREHQPQRADFSRAGLDDAATEQTPLRGRNRAPKEVRIRRFSCASMWLIVLAVYSTIMSGVWLLVAIIMPRWGRTISTNGPISLSTANLLTAAFAKSIDMSLVTLAMAFVGQVLTRRAIATREGMTMAEVTMRHWIAQPGTICTNLGAVRHAGHSLLGIMALVTAVVVMLYTTASDTMVRPKLQFGPWEKMQLNSTVWASYANPTYVNNTCTTPISVAMDPYAGESCLAVQYSGDSFSDFLAFLSTWLDTGNASIEQAKRPQAQSMLWNNVTMIGTWIETQYSNVTRNFETYSRIINNASLAMPHPGGLAFRPRTCVYAAATNRELNGILQPSDLDGVGSYNVSASVVSPAVNVLCVNMDADELAPLVYTAWPHANVTATNVVNQTKGWYGWNSEVPGPDEWSNTTVVDDIFQWSTEPRRLPPVFQMYPSDHNTIANDTGSHSDSVYVLGKSSGMPNYTLCELHSWLAIQCSTQFNVTGTTSMAMSAACAQDVAYVPENASLFTANPDAYVHTMGAGASAAFAARSPDWRALLQEWTLGLNLAGGLGNDDAAVARILTALALAAPRLGAALPSLAEALAALAANTLVAAARDTPFVHYCDRAAGAPVRFAARVRAQAYASWHPEPWQAVFYAVLAAALALSALCLGYLCSLGLVTDVLEPTRLFAIATARGRGGAARAPTPEPEGGPLEGKRTRGPQLGTPYLLSYHEDGGHFVFEEAAEGARGAPRAANGLGVRADHGAKRKSFGLSFDTRRWLP